MGCFGFVWDDVKFFNMKRVDLSLTCKQENERKLIVGLMMLIYIYIYIYIYKTEIFETPTIFHINTILK